MQTYFRPKSANFAKSKYLSYDTGFLLIHSLKLKKILLAARDPNRRGPLTAGGSHDHRGPLTAGGPCAQPAPEASIPP